MSAEPSTKPAVPAEDADRAVFYGFVGRILQCAPSQDDLNAIRDFQPDGTLIGDLLAGLAEAARESQLTDISRAYHDLFIGLGRGELVPYGSYYLTGFLHEKPLAELRSSMAHFGIERETGVKEPEDHIAALMQMMAGLITGDFGQVATQDEQKQFFTKHVGSWAPHFFKDLAGQKTSAFYASVGALGSALMEVEAEAFAMGG